jgi:phosphotransferase system HPr (HPr) family protein
MKTARVTVRWQRGLHMLTAARLVQLAQRFHSSIHLRLGTRMADARSILNILLLNATLGTSLDIEASGRDELEALQALEDFLGNPGGGEDWVTKAQLRSESTAAGVRRLRTD